MAVDMMVNKNAWVSAQGSPTQTAAEVSPYGTHYPFRAVSVISRASALWVGTATVEGSVDGTNWVTVLTLAPVQGGQVHQYADQFCLPLLRLNVSAVTAGNITVDASMLSEGRANN